MSRDALEPCEATEVTLDAHARPAAHARSIRTRWSGQLVDDISSPSPMWECAVERPERMSFRMPIVEPMRSSLAAPRLSARRGRIQCQAAAFQIRPAKGASTGV